MLSYFMEDVNNFWFNELEPRQWFEKDPGLDLKIKQRFGSTYLQAVEGELYTWRASADGRLAEIIVLDQFPRNMFRNQSKAFRFDLSALILAQICVACGDDLKIEREKRKFIYMPFMHSESIEIHKAAKPLFEKLEDIETMKFATAHYDIIQKFGRYPHRNDMLGRASTKSETEFLKSSESSF